jgi:hypothetical protein
MRLRCMRAEPSKVNQPCLYSRITVSKSPDICRLVLTVPTEADKSELYSSWKVDHSDGIRTYRTQSFGHSNVYVPVAGSDITA